MIPARNYRHARESGHPGRPVLRLRPWAPASAGVTEKEELGTICLVRTTRLAALVSVTCGTWKPPALPLEGSPRDALRKGEKIPASDEDTASSNGTDPLFA